MICRLHYDDMQKQKATSSGVTIGKVVQKSSEYQGLRKILLTAIWVIALLLGKFGRVVIGVLLFILMDFSAPLKTHIA